MDTKMWRLTKIPLKVTTSPEFRLKNGTWSTNVLTYLIKALKNGNGPPITWVLVSSWHNSLLRSYYLCSFCSSPLTKSFFGQNGANEINWGSISTKTSLLKACICRSFYFLVLMSWFVLSTCRQKPIRFLGIQWSLWTSLR